MKLDSEAQRTQLLELLAQVPLQTTIGSIEQQAQLVTGILQPIRMATILGDEGPSEENSTPDISPDEAQDPPITTPDA